MAQELALKIDVDTDKGTEIGVPNLLNLLHKYNISASFFVSLGPDNTGRALKRIFRKGFFQKVQRTNVLQIYGLKTLLNGILWPGPHIGKRHSSLLRDIPCHGHDVGIHCYDHVKWQDSVHSMSLCRIKEEFQKARDVYSHIYHEEASFAGAPGWQANEKSYETYDEAGLLYASDCRGETPFFPESGDRVFRTLQIPTTLPTLDELLGRPDYPFETLTDHYMGLLDKKKVNVLTIHAELEGQLYLGWFEQFLKACQKKHVHFIKLSEIAQRHLQDRHTIPIHKVRACAIDGRAGTLACQHL